MSHDHDHEQLCHRTWHFSPTFSRLKQFKLIREEAENLSKNQLSFAEYSRHLISYDIKP